MHITIVKAHLKPLLVNESKTRRSVFHTYRRPSPSVDLKTIGKVKPFSCTYFRLNSTINVKQLGERKSQYAGSFI